MPASEKRYLGFFYALSAYIFWGIQPAFWKLLTRIPPVIVLAHRIIWSLLFFGVILGFKLPIAKITMLRKDRRSLSLLFIPALLIGVTWGVYLWAVMNDFVLEASLGYFICPLFSIILGVKVLRERLTKIQRISAILAATGVLAMTVFYGRVPFIALTLAGSWALYGMLRKQSILSSVEGLFIEMLILAIPSAIYLIFITATKFPIKEYTTPEVILLLSTGIISGLPLIAFVKGAKTVRLTTLGLMQYIYPSILFILGVWVYHEPLNLQRLSGFLLIWIALALASIDAIAVIFRYIKRD
ncbi:MAG: EamA family transporter RarD [Ignavibacteria bacterium]|nr:EamA family transporter RarD [Ignavibacteria bacterium]